LVSKMQSPENQTFYRGGDRILGGVCSGLAEGFHVEALWVRLAFVVLTFLNGIGLVLYIVLWVLMPERSGYRPTGQGVFVSMSNDVKRAWADLRTQFGGSAATSSAAATAAPNPPAAASAPAASGEAVPAAPAASQVPQTVARNPSFIFGAILIVICIAFLAANTNFINWSVLWPATLVVVGIALLVRNLERRR
jgi:phage shock protein PspC (stress-responsive transcriptional regulator)